MGVVLARYTYVHICMLYIEHVCMKIQEIQGRTFLCMVELES